MLRPSRPPASASRAGRPAVRLDQALVDRGLAESRERAQRLIRAGAVWVEGERSDKPGRRVAADAAIELRADPCPYVSRGGLKLAGALARLGMTDLRGVRALDVGASTGGFTDCLLQHGAAHVRAVDVGRGLLHERLRRDARVTVHEGLNARTLTLDAVGGMPFDLATIDVSFISLRLVLPAIAGCLAPGGRVLALVKPQFEAGRQAVSRGGVVRGRDAHRRVLLDLARWVSETGWRVAAMCPSPLAGPAGNREFFFLLARRGEPSDATQDDRDPTGRLQMAVERMLDELYNPPERASGGATSPPAVPGAPDGKGQP